MATAKRKVKPPKGFDSNFEYDLHQVLKGCDYHTQMIDYVQHKRYEPDFLYKKGSTVTLIEAKGRFRDSSEAKKYIDIRESLPPNYELVFVFQKPFTPMPFAKKRKDGTKFTHAAWADKNNFTWYSDYELPTEWQRC